jgi:hypothetical protein
MIRYYASSPKGELIDKIMENKLTEPTIDLETHVTQLETEVTQLETEVTRLNKLTAERLEWVREQRLITSIQHTEET